MADPTDVIRVVRVGEEPGASAAASLERETDRFTVRSAASAAEGLELLADTLVDCVVSGYAIGDRDGIEFLEAVRGEYPEIPFVLYTARGSEALASEAITAGVTDYVPAEEGHATLAARIVRAVENHRTGRDRGGNDGGLRRTKHNYQAIFEDPNILVGLVDTDGTVLDINRTAMEYIDATLAEVTGVPFWGTPWFDHAETAREEIRQWVDRAANGEYVEFEADRVQPNGDVYTVEGVFRPVTDDDGEVVSLLITSRDVTDRERRERQLETLNRTTRELMGAEAREKISEIGVEAARDVLDLNTSGIHLYEAQSGLVPVAITDEGQELIGEPPTFTEGDSIAWRVYEQGQPLAKDRVGDDPDAHNPETPVRSELYLPLGKYGILVAGSPRPEAFDESDVLLGEMLAGSLTAAFEQAEQTRKLRERERELTRQNDRLEQFASVVSHDLRNPLNVAKGRLGMAEAEHDSEHLEAVGKAHERIEALIDDLLTLARQGQAVTDPEPVDLAALLETCWTNVRTDDAALTVGVDRTVPADRSRLKQLFENLFRNCVEHGSTSSRPQADDSAERSSAGDRTEFDNSAQHAGDGVTVTVGALAGGFYVEDDGPGIPEGERESVFDAGYSTDPEGTGFGLSIVEEIAEAHG